MTIVETDMAMRAWESYAQIPALSSGPFVATRTGLQVFGEPSAAVWTAYVDAMLRLAEGILWIVGDALIWGERHHPEAYEEMLQCGLYEPHTLSNARWVASRVRPEQRRPELPWSAHEAVASLGPVEQDEILAEGVQEDWTRDQVREEVRERKGLGGDRFAEALSRARAAIRDCLGVADTDERIDAVKLAMAALEDVR